MKTFVIMQNDNPVAVVQCNDKDKAREAAAMLAYKEFKKDEQHWKRECNNPSNKIKRDAFDYYLRRVFWRPYELPLLEIMSGRLVSLQEKFAVHTH